MSLIKKNIGGATKKQAPATPASILTSGLSEILKTLGFKGEINTTEAKIILEDYKDKVNQKIYIDPIHYIIKERDITDEELIDDLIISCRGKKHLLEWIPSRAGVIDMIQKHTFLIKVIKRFKIVIVSVEDEDVINIAGLSPAIVILASKFIKIQWNKAGQKIPTIGECVITKEKFDAIYKEQIK